MQAPKTDCIVLISAYKDSSNEEKSMRKFNKQSIAILMFQDVSILHLIGIQRTDKFWFALNLQKLTNII